MVAAIDGADEVANQGQWTSMRRLLQTPGFDEHCKLVITHRSLQEIFRGLHLDEVYDENKVFTIEVSDFEPTMIKDKKSAAQLADVIGCSADDILNAAEVISESLRHPLMLGVLAALSTEPNVLGNALGGDVDALHRVASEFMRRFHVKMSRRWLDCPVSNRRDVEVLLGTIAANTGQSGRLYGIGEWATPVVNSQLGVPHNRLLDECHSGGLITVEQGGRWYWRHSFVCDYLRSVYDTQGGD